MQGTDKEQLCCFLVVTAILMDSSSDSYFDGSSSDSQVRKQACDKLKTSLLSNFL